MTDNIRIKTTAQDSYFCKCFNCGYDGNTSDPAKKDHCEVCGNQYNFVVLTTTTTVTTERILTPAVQGGVEAVADSGAETQR